MSCELWEGGRGFRERCASISSDLHLRSEVGKGKQRELSSCVCYMRQEHTSDAEEAKQMAARDVEAATIKYEHGPIAAEVQAVQASMAAVVIRRRGDAGRRDCPKAIRARHGPPESVTLASSRFAQHCLSIRPADISAYQLRTRRRHLTRSALII